MDLIIRNARFYDRPGGPLDIGIANGRIAAIERDTLRWKLPELLRPH